MSKRIMPIALLACGIGWIAAAWAADPPHGEAKTVAELSDARLALAKKGFELSFERYCRNEGPENPYNVAVWSKRAVEVARLGDDKAKLKKILEEHRDRMRRLFQIVTEKQKAGLAAEIDKIEPEYLLLEAESWLEEAKSLN